MDDHQAHDDDHGGTGKYWAVFGALCLATFISFAVANSPIMNTPTVGWTVMLTISCIKALLVMLFFMHLIWEANWKYVLTVPATIMSVLLLLALVPDIGMRSVYYAEERSLHAAEPETPHVAHENEAHPEKHNEDDGGAGEPTAPESP